MLVAEVLRPRSFRRILIRGRDLFSAKLEPRDSASIQSNEVNI